MQLYKGANYIMNYSGLEDKYIYAHTGGFQGFKTHLRTKNKSHYNINNKGTY